MIKDSDLRIGNLLEYGDGYITVDINVLRDLNTYLQTGVKRIKLTQKLLIKSGFTAISIYDNFKLNCIEISSSSRIIQTNERFGFYLDGEIPEILKIRIEFVDQLQNIFYFLTGEELVFSSTEP